MNTKVERLQNNECPGNFRGHIKEQRTMRDKFATLQAENDELLRAVGGSLYTRAEDMISTSDMLLVL